MGLFPLIYEEMSEQTTDAKRLLTSKWPQSTKVCELDATSTQM